MQQLIQILHQQQYLWYLQCVMSFRNIFLNDLIVENLPLYSFNGQETFGIQSELWLNSKCVVKNSILSTILCFTIHYIYRTEQAALMHNYLLIQKKIGDTNSAHARLNEIWDNLYRIFSPLSKLLNHNFRLVIHGKNKIEPPTPQSTNL